MVPQVSFLEVCTALPLGSDGAVPEWLMLLPAGVSRGVDGRGPYNNDQPEVAAAASMEASRPLPFDYNHQTVFAALNGAPSPASGWIDRLEVRDGAIWGHVDWTDAGRAAVASREYRYVSPVFHHDKKTGQVQRLVSAALVNAPNLSELPAINARLGAILPSTGEAKTMDEELQARLAAALGLAANTSIEALVTQAETNRATATGAPDPALYVPMSAFADLQAQVAALRDTAAANQATSLVDDAAKAGKLTPAMREWGLAYASQDPAGFGKWLAAAPVIVAAGADPALAAIGGASGDGGDGAGLSSQELAVCARLGISADDYTASKKKAA